MPGTLGVGHGASANAEAAAPDVAVVDVESAAAVVAAAVVALADVPSSSSPHAATTRANAVMVATIVARRRWGAVPRRSRRVVVFMAPSQPENGLVSASHTVPAGGASRSTRYFTRQPSMQVLWSLSLTCP